MAEKEVNTITHLLEMEQRASAMTLKAQEDADKKIAAAKAQADSEFKSQYEKIVETEEQSYNQKISALESEKAQKIAGYREKIMAVPQDKPSFNSYLDSILLA